MNQLDRELLKKRAEALVAIGERILNFENDTDECAGVAFKWGYLIIRKPNRFLHAFKEGDLRIDPHLLEEAVWHYQENVPGPSSLTEDEKSLLDEHNRQATNYMKKRDEVIDLNQRRRCAR